MVIGYDFLLPRPHRRDTQAQLKRSRELEAKGMSELQLYKGRPKLGEDPLSLGKERLPRRPLGLLSPHNV